MKIIKKIRELHNKLIQKLDTPDTIRWMFEFNSAKNNDINE